MADLQDFIEEITLNNINFCAVCFRTERERKLVPPVALSKFIKITSLEQLSDNEYACIYCERQAAMALKLYNSLTYSRHVSAVLFTLAKKRRMTPKSIAYLLPTKIRGQHSGPNSVKRNKLLTSLRQYQKYSQTDVLIVDAMGVDDTTNKMSDPSIIIEDDDEIPSNMPRLVPIEKLLGPQTQITKNATNIGDNVILYPIKTANEDHYLILPNNGLSHNVTNNVQVILPNISNETIPVLLPNGNIVGLQQTNPIVMPDGNIQEHSVTFDDTININKVKPIEEVILPDNGSTANKIGKNDGSVDKTEVSAEDDSGTAKVCHISDLRSLKEIEVNVKPPEPKRSDKSIDWEDKIPMDVISFMDANDPNSATVLGQNAQKTQKAQKAQSYPIKVTSDSIQNNFIQTVPTKAGLNKSDSIIPTNNLKQSGSNKSGSIIPTKDFNQTGRNNSGSIIQRIDFNQTGRNNSSPIIPTVDFNQTGRNNSGSIIQRIDFNQTGRNNSGPIIPTIDFNQTGINKSGSIIPTNNLNQSGPNNSGSIIPTKDLKKTGDSNFRLLKATDPPPFLNKTSRTYSRKMAAQAPDLGDLLMPTGKCRRKIYERKRKIDDDDVIILS